MTARPDPAAPVTPAGLAADLRVVIGKLKRRLQSQASLGDLTNSQIAVLAQLEREGPATVTTLARTEGMRPQSMGANVAALEAAGHLIGTPDPDDGRQTLWSLTPTCRDWIAAGRAERQDWLARTLQARLTLQEQADLARAVVLLERLAQP
jgi:DNA-binding MarR family transcriptional regulator